MIVLQRNLQEREAKEGTASRTAILDVSLRDVPRRDGELTKALFTGLGMDDAFLSSAPWLPPRSLPASSC